MFTPEPLAGILSHDPVLDDPLQITVSPTAQLFGVVLDPLGVALPATLHIKKSPLL